MDDRRGPAGDGGAGLRLRQLALLRYGHLSDVVLDIPAAASLCVVHGANEAGKSTALAAIGDALFGFGHRTAFDFLHGGSHLRVGVSVQARDGTEGRFVRRKGRAGTLTANDGEPVAEAGMQRFLGGATRELFEHAFGLNAERLRQGGAALAEGGGAVGESLFAAGTGLLGLRAALSALDEEAKALAGPGKKKQAMTEAVERAAKARRLSQERAVMPRSWQEADAAFAASVSGLAAVQEAASRLRAETSRLERVRRVAPLLAGLATARSALSALSDAPAMPADAAEAMERALAALAESGRDGEREASEARRLSESRAALPHDPAILAAQDAIDVLAGQIGVARQAWADLPEVRLEIEALRMRAAAATGGIWPGLSPEEARERIPSAGASRAVQRLISEHAALSARSAEAKREHQAALARRDAAAAALQDRPVPADPASLRATAGRVRGEGRLDDELARAELQFAAAGQKADAARSALPLWRGDGSALAACPMPLPGEEAAVAARLASADEAALVAASEAETVAGEIAALEEAVSALARGETVPTSGAVQDARALRDQAWRLVRRALESGRLDDGNPADLLPDRFEALRDAADRFADRRADEAQRVADYMGACARLDLLRGRQHSISERRAKTEQEAATVRAAWQVLWVPARIMPAGPAGMADWRRGREDALRLAESAAEAGRRCRELAGRRDAARAALAGFVRPAEADTPLAAMLTQAEAACAAAEAEVKEHSSLMRTLAREEEAVRGLERSVHGLGEETAAWQARWSAAMAPLGLAADCTADGAEDALAAWASVREAAPGWEAGERRVWQMSAAIQAFEAAAGAAARDDGGDDDPFLKAGRLIRRLAGARQAQAEAEALTKRIERHERAVAEADAGGQAAEAALARLRGLAGVADVAGLALAIGRARERSVALADVARLGAGLLAQGDGLDEQALQDEAAGVGADAAVARLAEIAAEAAELDARREELSASRAEARAALDAMRQGKDAAALAQDARQAVGEAANAAERYARLHVARVLLRSGIDRFRRAQQGPLLRAAGGFFAALTGGRYMRLGVDEDAGGRPRLVAVAQDETECPVDALSEGTRDQLYLALRAAAVEAHSAGAEPLPFIADDLLVHFDDVRAAAAVGLLARLGQTTQVILFTHHDHVAALAAAHGTPDVSLIRL